MTSLTGDTEFTNLKFSQSFYIFVDAYYVGHGVLLFQLNTTNKKDSRLLSTQQQKFSTYDRKLGAATFALQTVQVNSEQSPLMHAY